ncbi:TetR family transcriptional regulator C-terminal domain-containing protein [Kribbella sp. NPDC004875]|uniref:TetR family transcriptional regulator C-terminal domain-containing protein n=1 Tax=Kribbella sp. NPDC004875 TaxID=3364107 RepID=UPI00368CBB35
MIDALARALQEGFVPGPAEKPPGLDRLLALIDGYLGALAHSSTSGHAFLLLWSGAVTDTQLAPTFRERDSAFRDDIAADVAAGIAEGMVRDTVRPESVAVAVIAQLRGIGMQRLLDVDAVDVERLRTEVTEQWRRALSAGSR